MLLCANTDRMHQFTFSVYHPSRVLGCLFLFPCLFLLSIFLGAHFNSILISILAVILSLLLLYYYTVGHITITFQEEKLNFNWKTKILFNYKYIKETKLEDIKTIVIDQGRLLKKIKTSDRVIHINNSKRSSPEAYDFINHLKLMSAPHNPEIIDSWDEFAKKGYLKLAYRFTTFILILSLLLVATFILVKGFKAKYLFVFLLFVPQMFLHKQEMKNKLKK